MYASRTLNNKRGQAVIYLALLLFVLVGFAALVIDLGYMYVNKAKLQNAADAAALAGAGKIRIPDVFANLSSRQSAKYYATLNEASLDLNQNTTNDQSGDIVLGVFNPNTDPKFTAVPVMGTYSSINAVKVVARRNDDTGTGINASLKYDMFLGKIFGWDQMGTKASAIAYRPPRARIYILIGRNVCDMTPPITLAINDPVFGSRMAWTTLTQQNTNANDVTDNYFCPADKLPFVDVCGTSIFATGGNVNVAFQSVELDFYDPSYDRDNKTFSGGDVISWNVITPISFDDDPTIQPAPQPVWGYAQLTLTRACGSGGGNPCNAQNRNFTAPNSAGCSGNEIIISNIECVSCSSRFRLIGAKPVLGQ